MDEMRQLVRILVKIIPHSITFLASAEEGGGGNRISEERIKYFLDCTLGEAPRPSWGVPQGWGEYLAGGHPIHLHMQACLPLYRFVLVLGGAGMTDASCRNITSLCGMTRQCTTRNQSAGRALG